MEKLGIEKLSEAIVATISLGEKIEKKLDDGKLSIMEAVQVAVGSFASVVSVAKSAKDIKAEIEDLDGAEKIALVELIEKELDLENEKLEAAIEAAVDFLLTIDVLVNSVKK